MKTSISYRKKKKYIFYSVLDKALKNLQAVGGPLVTDANESMSDSGLFSEDSEALSVLLMAPKVLLHAIVVW